MSAPPAEKTEGVGDELIPAAAIVNCAGFTGADAARILGVPEAVLVDASENYSPSSSLCSFSPPESSEGVGFYLTASGSIERAAAEMEQGRGMGEVAQVVIDRATNTQSVEAPIQAAQSLGEEAYFMDVNGTLMIRVANVQIQVLPMEDREQMKAVGLQVAQRLQDY
ncbi:MAG: hypothetical protein R3E82_10650 [Pseudomonadales bacterium]|nr:hypothetical protein [Pseudomonadales bacterium]